MEAPRGLPGHIPHCPDTVLRLAKPLYDLKQTPREWHANLRDVFLSLGFTPAHNDPSLFIHKGEDGSCIRVYADDMLLVSKSLATLDQLRDQLRTHFLVKDLGDV